MAVKAITLKLGTWTRLMPSTKILESIYSRHLEFSMFILHLLSELMGIL